MTVFRVLLYPFAILFQIGSSVRNYLYDIGHKRSFSFGVPVISVGNLNVGGSGKTPMIEYLIELLKARYTVVTLSRGYKRATQGFRKAVETDTARTIGDEPMQIFRKYGSQVKVTVGEDRAFAIPHILQEWPETDVILLDDAMQHRAVKPHLSIMVTEFDKPFYKDHLLPYGRLREARNGSRRADIIVVTKCNANLDVEARNLVERNIAKYAGSKPVFFSSIRYGKPIALAGPDAVVNQVILVTGIANGSAFEKHCRDNFKVLKHFSFPDHHRYTADDLRNIEGYCKSQSVPLTILTTEKDKVKLEESGLKEFLGEYAWFYVPIRHEFIEDGLKFDELVVAAIAAQPKNSE